MVLGFFVGVSCLNQPQARARGAVPPPRSRLGLGKKDSVMTSDRLIIFDTTLRDGEQSPGASMNLAEKLEIAHALQELGVDVIEAGFPIASPGDFEAVQAVARQVQGPIICGLARCSADDIDRA